MTDFKILVGSEFDPNNLDPACFLVCASVQGNFLSKETRKTVCDQPVTGRYVALQLSSAENLHICDFRVYGQPGKGKIYNIVFCSENVY